MTAFSNAIVIAADLSSGDDKKVAMVGCFWNMNSPKQNKTNPLLFACLFIF